MRNIELVGEIFIYETNHSFSSPIQLSSESLGLFGLSIHLPFFVFASSDGAVQIVQTQSWLLATNPIYWLIVCLVLNDASILSDGIRLHMVWMEKVKVCNK